jgi:hypothetical protein
MAGCIEKNNNPWDSRNSGLFLHQLNGFQLLKGYFLELMQARAGCEAFVLASTYFVVCPRQHRDHNEAATQ